MLYILAFFAGLYLGSAATAWQLIRIHRANLQEITKTAQDQAAKQWEERAAQWAREEDLLYRELGRWEESRHKDHEAQLIGSLPGDPVAELIIDHEQERQSQAADLSRAAMRRNREEFRARLAEIARGSGGA